MTKHGKVALRMVLRTKNLVGATAQCRSPLLNGAVMWFHRLKASIRRIKSPSLEIDDPSVADDEHALWIFRGRSTTPDQSKYYDHRMRSPRQRSTAGADAETQTVWPIKSRENLLDKLSLKPIEQIIDANRVESWEIIEWTDINEDTEWIGS